MEKALEISNQTSRLSKPTSQPNNIYEDTKRLIKAQIIVKLVLDVCVILTLLFILQAYTIKLQLATDVVSKQPQYDMSNLQAQMNDISKFIIEHKEREEKMTNNAIRLSNELKRLRE